MNFLNIHKNGNFIEFDFPANMHPCVVVLAGNRTRPLNQKSLEKMFTFFNKHIQKVNPQINKKFVNKSISKRDYCLWLSVSARNEFWTSALPTDVCRATNLHDFD